MKLLTLHIIILFLSISINTYSQINQTIEDFFRAENYYQTNKTDSAISILKKYKENEHYAILLGKIYSEQNDYIKAIAVLKDYYKSYTSNDVAFSLSQIYAQIGFEEEAIFWLEEYFNKNNKPLFYSQIIGNKEFTNIENTESWKTFWNKNNYNKNYLPFEEALYLLKMQKYDEATTLLKSFPDNSFSYYKYYLMSKIYFDLEDYNLAYKNIKLSLENNKKFVEANYLKSEIEKITKKYELASAEIDYLLKQDTYNANNLYKKAEILYLTKNYAQAEIFVEKYLKNFSTNKEALFLKAKINLELNRKELAIICLNTLLIDGSLHKEYYELRGNILYDFGEWNLAKNDFSMSLDIDPQQGEMYYKSGICWLKMNQNEKACYNLKQAVQLRYQKAQKDYYKNCE